MSLRPSSLSRERLAVTLVFFANGLGIGAWATSIPHFKAAFGLSDGALSLPLLAFSAGAIVTMPLVGLLAARWRTGAATRVAALVFAFGLILPFVAGGLGGLVITGAILGVTNGAVDVLMNAHAADVEKRWGRPIMSSIHAAFSLGGLAGALIGAGAAALDPDHALAMPAAALFAAAFTGIAWSRLGGGARGAAGPALALPDRSSLALSLAALASMICEGAMGDWSGVYLATEAGASATGTAAGFAAFSAAMVLGRLTGDRVVDAFGRPAVVRCGGAIAAAGLVLAVALPRPSAAALGFALVGLGLANVVPVIFGVAGRAGAAGIAMAATMGYAGFLLGPPAIGAVATLASLRLAFVVLVLAALALVALGRAVRLEPEAARDPAAGRDAA